MNYCVLFLIFVNVFCSLEGVTLRDKVAQLLIVGFHDYKYGTESTIAHHIVNNRVGGVILYNHKGFRNIQSPDQLKRLIEEMKEASDGEVLVGIDQEGGYVNNLPERQGFEQDNVSAKAFGMCGDEESTYEVAKGLGAYMKDLGIDINFAPCVDLAINKANFIVRKERSFGGDYDFTTMQAQAYIQGMHENGVHTAIKHFPGHGSSAGDTHNGLVDVTETWKKEEIYPYISLVSGGYDDMVMTTHCVNRQLDSSEVVVNKRGEQVVPPATFSHQILTRLLREEIGFDGVIVSDDMCMQAILREYDFEDALKYALNAGVDMMIIANHRKDYTKYAIESIVRMVESGEINKARIDEAYGRVRRFKDRFRELSIECE